MDQDTQNKMAGLEKKIDEIYASVEKTRKIIMWTGIITIAVIILPLIAMMFVIPSFLGNYTTTLDTLGGL
ncbi:MAG: hypothetical protein A2431_01435 [Candidatus Zambryskibacteria bacterium RIFOXYC1_FULL_39_10]|uniref:Uncharacterized protein n=1 Tax=Candidatus Zambryskibacteria bacterium RIFOXYC1_FULL_39_10 TaxID=1802779 RepID=A0A1G2V3Z3_9BACT|nr:MAG: hypothetical protein A2605_03295 [Candidatus Zambryskibacteria bacterium RIFOXYD1_FULL_39_35]OHB16343.1 MAG: hypothetical protein A2431_01435 [Candidatus Zambryskibacteria bacterium RIFOXYC1_FULL_39_10]